MKAKTYKESELIFPDKPISKKFQDLTGLVFGRLTVIGFSGKTGIQPKWYCRCECGNIVNVFSSNLKRGTSSSCGCYFDEVNKEKSIVHGLSAGNKSPEYRSWVAMINRTSSKSNKCYQNYGGRGITVCDRWLDVRNFVEDMGLKPSDKHTIDRIDVNGNYCPENCRWATQKEQAVNKTTNRRLTYNGITKTMGEWENDLGFKVGTIKGRLRIGWSVDKAISEPVRASKSR